MFHGDSLHGMKDALGLPCDAPAHELPWEHVGPGGYVGKGGVSQLVSAGAAQAAVRIDNATAWLIATANGGIWRTKDLLHANGPHWEQALDGQPIACTSISAKTGCLTSKPT